MDKLTDLLSRREGQVAIAIGASGLGYMAYRMTRNLPPGPIGWPIIGGLLELNSGVMHADFLRLSERYGDVFSLYASDKLIVGLNSYEAIKEAFVDKADIFSDRMDSFGGSVYKDDLKDELFFPPYSEQWRKNKRDIISNLKTFGFGTTKGEANITAEVENLINVITEYRGAPLNPDSFIHKALANVILSIVYQMRFAHDDPDMERFLQILENVTTAFDESSSANLMPNIIRSVKQTKLTLKYREAERVAIDYNVKHIKDHIETMDPNNPRDFVDAYVSERGVGNVKLEVLAKTIAICLTPDPIYTLGVSLSWAIFSLAYHQDIQTKLQNEIMEVVGDSRRPSLSDKNSMHYTEAFIREVLRMYPSFTVTMPHVNKTPGTIQGYNIPPKSMTFANIWAVHHNSKYFDNPNKFDPERFLTPDGKLKNYPQIMTFSLGHRKCPGDHVSKMELFLFVSNLAQAFDLSFPEEEPRPDPHPVFEGIVPRPTAYKIVAKPRM